MNAFLNVSESSNLTKSANVHSFKMFIFFLHAVINAGLFFDTVISLHETLPVL